MGKKPIVSVTYENERISIKKQLNLLKMFDSEVDLHSLKLVERASPSNPEAKTLSAWSILL